MARHHQSRGYPLHRDRSAGAEAARRHIEAARALSHELGGTDKDVKQYFFGLPPHELNAILDEYGQRHGSSAKEYAEQTMASWRSGRTQMSGLVAERLFKLLPPRMPLAAKYKLTENLWMHFGPRSKKRLRIGLDVVVDDAVAAVRCHFEQVVLRYKIPPELERRFTWLAEGDVDVKQSLLNHLRAEERQLLSEGARHQLPVMLAHLRSERAALTSRMAQTLKIGNHELELLVDPNASGVHLEEHVYLEHKTKNENSGNTRSLSDRFGCLIVATGIFLLYFFLHA